MAAILATRERLPLQIRRQVELDLRWYRDACEAAAEARQEIGDLLSPATAKWSHIGSQQGQPGDPTFGRAVKLQRVHARMRRDAFVARVVGKWLRDLTADERLLLQMRYGVHTQAVPATEGEIAAALHTSVPTVQRMTDDLLYRAAVRLLYWPTRASRRTAGHAASRWHAHTMRGLRGARA